eukprot:TRINITY_DN16486_c0_g1_i1.p1 TRINITY_DN16486_c0_g1~~TRINITY_DN16486_c0_g1_i1.p1  ORF type:complete len:157 (+),score=33.97 TRINITY_DN16486_c0_g1_i1:540-1010(+)
MKMKFLFIFFFLYLFVVKGDDVIFEFGEKSFSMCQNLESVLNIKTTKRGICDAVQEMFESTLNELAVALAENMEMSFSVEFGENFNKPPWSVLGEKIIRKASEEAIKNDQNDPEKIKKYVEHVFGSWILKAAAGDDKLVSIYEQLNNGPSDEVPQL